MSNMNLDTGYYNDFELQLKKADYKWFTDTMKSSIRGFQKKFIDKLGIKYDN